LRALEVARLDALQVALWPKIEAGDVQAISAALRIIETRARLLGLCGKKTVVNDAPAYLVIG
jgi:hypothetical protein